jgi:hypothetical protein
MNEVTRGEYWWRGHDRPAVGVYVGWFTYCSCVGTCCGHYMYLCGPTVPLGIQLAAIGPEFIGFRVV